MYKKPFLFTAALFVFALGRSQPPLFNDFKKACITVEAGPSLGIMNVVGQFVFFPPSSVKAGFNAGVGLQYKIAGNLYLQPQVAFVVKGTGKGNIPQYPASEFVNDFYIDYFELPVTIIYNPSLARGRFFAGGGMFVALAVKTVETYGDGTSINIPFVNSVYSDGSVATSEISLTRWDVGADFVAGCNISRHFYVKFRGEWGLKNISTTYTGSYYAGLKSEYYTQAYMFLAGVRF